MFIYVFISFILLVEVKKKYIYKYTKIASSLSVHSLSGGRSAYLSVPLFFLPYFSLSPFFFYNCPIMFPFLLFFVGCLSVFVLVWLRFVFPSVFFFFLYTRLSNY